MGKSYVIGVGDIPTPITGAAQDEIQNFLWRTYGYDTAVISWGSLWESVGTEVSGKGGRISRRISAYLFKTHGMKLSPGVLEHIGMIAHKFVRVGGETFNVRFINRVVDLWRPGRYGDSGSCYWTYNKGARDAIMDAGGAGVTFDSADGEPIARCWIAPLSYDDDRVGLWNVYSRCGHGWTLDTVCDILTRGEGSPFQGLPFVRKSIVNDGSTGGTVYINTTGALIHAPDADVSDSFYDLGIDIDTYEECVECGCRLREDDAMHLDDGEGPFCANCYPGVDCAHCGREIDSRYAQAVGDGYACARCVSRYYTLCEKCDEYYADDEMAELTLPDGSVESVCQECYRKHSCIECHDAEGTIPVIGGSVCKHCYADNYSFVTVAVAPSQMELVVA